MTATDMMGLCCSQEPIDFRRFLVVSNEKELVAFKPVLILGNSLDDVKIGDFYKAQPRG